MRGVGSHGYSWSSFVSEDIAYRLGLSNGGISPQGIDNRAYGFPLRCLQEHPKGVLLAIRRRKAQLSRAERHRADASGTLQRKAQPSSAERHRDRRSHAPEPPPATGATSTSSVLPALAPGRHLTQPQNVQQYRASPGVAVARALLWSAVVLLTDWLQPNSRPEKLLRRCPYSVPRSLTARLGKSFPINSSFIGVISS
mgnify:CR=1 FL=1